MSNKKIIIEGVTESGETFRPSDWAERMSGKAGRTRNRRLVYSPMLQPTYQNGQKCVILDEELRATNPTLYRTVLAFAKANKLRIHEVEDNDDHDKA